MCLLADDFAADGRQLEEQSRDVHHCHQADIQAWSRCAARHKELADWVNARVVEQSTK
jgi:hypothetical protein